MSSGTCPNCGQPLSAGKHGAYCPPCLLRLAEATPVQAAPRVFGDHELIEEIARGGMGVVFRARQRSLDREVALKVVLGAELADLETRRRLQREAHAVASLHHPHIVPVYEIGEHDLQPYFSMRFVPGGETIAHWAARERGNHRAIAAAVAQVARAIAHAHERGVLHRDLKPSNVLWDPEGGPQVSDFGLAKWLDDPRSSLSLPGQLIGSPSYMAPEQAEGRAEEITTATDVHGLGALLYELLTGEPPFHAATSLETLHRVRNEPPVAPTRRVPSLDRDLETICLKCLEKIPAHRYPSAREVAEELERFGRGEPIRARRASAAAQLSRWIRRNPRLAASLAGAVALLLAGMLGTTWQWRKAERARLGEQQARVEATSYVSDLLARSGFTAARDGDPSRAALWFAHAATATGDPVRRSVNGLRWRAWRDDAPVALRAFSADARRFTMLAWNPTQTTLAVQHRQPASASVWDLARETRWKPDLPMDWAHWLPRSGRLLVLHGEEARILVYPSGQEVARQAVGAGVEQVIVSPDDRWVGLGGVEPRLWDSAGGRVLRLPTVPDRLPAVTGDLAGPGTVMLEFSRDGRRVLLTGRGWRGVCALEDPERFAVGPLPCVHAGGSGFVGAGRSFFVHSPAAQLLTVDAVTGAELAAVPLPLPWDGGRQGAIERPSPDGRFLVRSGATGVDTTTGQAREFPAHRNVAFDFDYSSDGALLATASADDTVRCWRLDGGGAGQLIGWHQEAATSVAFSPDGRLLATGQAGGGLVRVWRLPAPPMVRPIPDDGPTWIKVSDDGEWLVPGGWTDLNAKRTSTRVYRAATAEPAGPELAPGGVLMDSAFAPDASWLAIATSTVEARPATFAAGAPGTGQVSFWNFRTGQRQGEPVAFPVEPRGLAAHPDGRKVAVFGAGRSLYELDRTTGTLRELCAPTRRTEENESAMARCRYSPDGRLLVAWGRDIPPLVWNAETGQRVPFPGWEEARSWNVDFHGATLALATRAGRIPLLRVPDGTEAAPSLEDSNWIFFARFDPAGSAVMTGGRGRVARLWDWRQGRLLVPPMVHEDEVFDARFVPGTPYLVTGGRDGGVHFWDTRTGQPARGSIRLGGQVNQVFVVEGGRLLVNRPHFAPDEPTGALVLDLPALLAAPALPPEEFVPLAELDASASVRNATLDPLGAAEWIRRWREFRARHPEWHRW